MMSAPGRTPAINRNFSGAGGQVNGAQGIWREHAFCSVPFGELQLGRGGPEMTARYLEDFEVGQTYGSGRLRVAEERIKSFAAEFDPQPFHLDANAARTSMLRGLAASGWHTAALTMRLLVESELKPAGGIVGTGFDELRWPRPVRPADELRVESQVLEVRPSKSRPEIGLIKVRTTTLNQDGEAVQVLVANLIVPRRPVNTSAG
jgi:acyl dehydratase